MGSVFDVAKTSGRRCTCLFLLVICCQFVLHISFVIPQPRLRAASSSFFPESTTVATSALFGKKAKRKAAGGGGKKKGGGSKRPAQAPQEKKSVKEARFDAEVRKINRFW